MKRAEWFTLRQLLIALTISFAAILTTWLFALWHTGVHLNYRNDQDSGLAAFYLAPEAGVSLQWSATGYSVWVWRGEANVRAIWGYW